MSDSVSDFHSVQFSLSSEYYDRLVYVADYFSWPVSKTASYMIMRAVADVHFGDDLLLSDWRDPRFKVKTKK